MPGEEDTYASYGHGWANVSNAPFQLFKKWNHEGGIATPFIAHWPAGIKAAGSLRHQPGHVIDIMATAIELASASYPEVRDGHAILPLEGISLVPAFADQPLEREAIFWEHLGNRAVRAGDWKLVRHGNRPWELYNLAADRIEMNNLARCHPAEVEHLEALWNAWAGRSLVAP